ncbi:hypothetical protein QBC39DRAFT_251283 [Podospora conica]|nr:hypothetical protein QBC39DRAFT_251283 [Schizothecium conicum]
MLRFGCSESSVQRLDPLVNPGMVPSTHQHQIVGGDAFAASMPYTDIAKISKCTTCHFDQDFSAYWTANVYFKARNGTYRRVPQIANEGNTGDNAGITVYYTAQVNQSTAFAPGFRMLAGDPGQKTSDNLGRNMQQCYRCYTQPNFRGTLASPCFDPVYDTDHFPKTKCTSIRSNIIFPQCWDGKNLDSPNHRDHVSHPVGGPVSFSNVSVKCPDTHPVKIPQVMLEVNWDTSVFNDEEWPTDGSQPLVLSTGDSVGFGQHADYVFGWQGTTLQDAMDGGCYLRNCSKLTSQSAATKNKCVVAPSVKEDLDACMYLFLFSASVYVLGLLTFTTGHKELPGGGEWTLE